MERWNKSLKVEKWLLQRLYMEASDKIELHLPMKISISVWDENAVPIERGPLIYVWKMKEN